MSTIKLKVSLAIIHFNTSKSNDNKGVRPDEDVTLQIHRLKNYPKIFKSVWITFFR